MKLSIVTTLYKSIEFVEPFYIRAAKVAKEITPDYEVIFVEDGCPQNSGEAVKKLQISHSNIKLIRFSRNFGHYRAILAGLKEAQGDYVFFLDSDLEEEPENLINFWQRMQGDPSIDCVYGQAPKRVGGFFKKSSGYLFWKAFNVMAGTHYNHSPLNMRLMKRNYVDALNAYNEYDVFFAQIAFDVGFNQTPLEVKKEFKGTSSYTLPKLIELFVKAVTNSTAYPLVLVFGLGSACFVLSILAVMFVFIRKFIYEQTIPLGWSSLIISIWAVGGLIMMSLGVLGIYTSKIFTEVKDRPRYFIKEKTKS